MPYIGQTLKYFGSQDQAKSMEGRRLLFVDGEGETFEARVDSVTLSASAEDSFHTISLDRVVNYSGFEYDAPSMEVFGNVVDASQGKTLDRVAIGSGDARALFQGFTLPKAPLTYLFDAMQCERQRRPPHLICMSMAFGGHA